jgi:hypothetical protein
MDTEAVVASYLRARCAGQHALMTDEDVAELLGGEVGAAIARLDGVGRERRLCANCGGTCCSEIGCELFAPQLGRCPIHAYRPMACRLHFCALFGAEQRATIVELRDVFTGCVDALEREGASSLLEIPPLAVVCPELVAAATPVVERVRLGQLDPAIAAEEISLAAARSRWGLRFEHEQERITPEAEALSCFTAPRRCV